MVGTKQSFRFVSVFCLPEHLWGNIQNEVCTILCSILNESLHFRRPRKKKKKKRTHLLERHLSLLQILHWNSIYLCQLVAREDDGYLWSDEKLRQRFARELNI